MTMMRDEFLSEEDLDLAAMTKEELYAYWNAWLEQAQSTNDADARTYSHGVLPSTKTPLDFSRGEGRLS